MINRLTNFLFLFNNKTKVNLSTIAKKIKIVEVGPRDGLQNEKHIIPTDVKVELVDKLSCTGIEWIEVSSFVHPKWVPQLSDAADVFSRIVRKQGINYSALVPNIQGLKAALKSNPNSIAVFIAASETFSKRNINCTIDESLQRLEKVFEVAKLNNLPVRGYISCVIGCPYEGPVCPDKVAQLTQHLWKKGCYEISLGDTIGIGTPDSIDKLLHTVIVKNKSCPVEALAIHCHDTNGMALNNILAALENHTIRTVDSSIAGLGGCPYAGPGAPGNVATESVVKCLISRGYQLGEQSNIDLDKLIEIGKWIREKINQLKVN